MARRDKLLHFLRDSVAIMTVAAFMFPILWTALDSIKPASAVYNKDGVILFGFLPTLSNYFTVLGTGPEAFDSRQSVLDSILVATAATCLALAIALPTAYAFRRLAGFQQQRLRRLVLVAWMLPPIVLIIPVFQIYHVTGLFDTRTGLVLAEAAIHLPVAILVLKSFFDEVPTEAAEAAMLDGAGEWQVFARIYVPMIHSGIAATAIIVFMFCWTEFFMAVFLSAFTRLLPVQISIMSNALGGSTMALSTLALVPSFVFVLLVQNHLVRGLSLGMQK